MLTDEFVENRVNSAFEQYNSRSQYLDNIKGDCKKLHYFKTFIEMEGLQYKYWKSYTQTKYYLKQLALENNCNDEELIESAFYEWLKICVNPNNELNYDFYFETEDLDKECQVKQILFENDGKGNLREIFENDEWQIRLRTISSWFLKRYDWSTATKISGFYKKSIFDQTPLIFPRLLGAIFIGFLSLIFSGDIWGLALELEWLYVYGISFLLVAIFILYLINECYNITHNKKVAIKRGGLVGLYGFIISLVVSLMIVYFLGEHFVGFNYGTGGWYLLGHLIFLENVLFFASAGLSIGIFIQILWEEKTITEPL